MPIPVERDTTVSQRVLLRDVVRMRVRNAIMNAELLPGEPLGDQELQDWFGFSRTPIKDGLNDLERMGLVDISPNRYTRVAEPGPEESRHALRVLDILCSGILKLAFEHLTDASAHLFVSHLEAVQQRVRLQPKSRPVELIVPAFQILERTCRNPLLTKLSRDSIDGLVFKARAAPQNRPWPEVQAHLQDLIDAVRERNSNRAAEATARIFKPVVPKR